MASVTIDGAIRELEGLLSQLSNRRDILRKIGLLLRSSTRLRFDTELNPERKRWQPSLRALREGNKTLTDEGKLRRSISFDSDNDEVVVGTNVSYGKFHQLGLRGNPERAFLGLSKSDREKILDLIESELNS